MIKLVSACLLGIKCRYDGSSKANRKVDFLSQEEILIPICPEQLGGLSTPRCPSEQKGDFVYRRDSIEVTEEFIKGAYITLDIARRYNITEAILKEKSPSCGVHKIYDGTFSGTLIEGCGLTTKVLKENGIKVISEEEL